MGGRRRKKTEVSEIILLQTELKLKLYKLDVQALPEQLCNFIVGLVLGLLFCGLAGTFAIISCFFRVYISTTFALFQSLSVTFITLL